MFFNVNKNLIMLQDNMIELNVYTRYANILCINYNKIQLLLNLVKFYCNIFYIDTLIIAHLSKDKVVKLF